MLLESLKESDGSAYRSYYNAEQLSWRKLNQRLDQVKGTGDWGLGSTNNNVWLQAPTKRRRATACRQTSPKNPDN